MIDCMAYIQSRNWLVTAGRDQCFFVWKFMGSHLIQFAEDYEIEAESDDDIGPVKTNGLQKDTTCKDSDSHQDSVFKVIVLPVSLAFTVW